MVKSGPICSQVITKAYMCVFCVIHLKNMYTHLGKAQTELAIDNFCADQGIKWSLLVNIHQTLVGFGKRQCRAWCTIGNVCLIFEELAMILAQVEARLNSRPLTALPQLDDGIEVLIRRPLEVLPNLAEPSQPISSLQRWHLCQVVTRLLRQRWSQEYLINLQQFAKWSRSSPNNKVGDIVCVSGEVSQPTKWPLTQIEQIHPGLDKKVRVITLRISIRTYTRPVVQIVPLIAQSDSP